MPVAVTLSILAVLVAIATLLGHRASTEEVILQSKAADQWELFQARNIRLHEMQSVADMLETFTPVEKEKAAAMREKYLSEVERYNKEEEEASQEAKSLEAERDVASKRGDRYDAGEVIPGNCLDRLLLNTAHQETNILDIRYRHRPTRLISHRQRLSSPLATVGNAS